GGTMTLGLAVAGWGVLFLLNRVKARGRPSPGFETPITSWRTAWLLVAIVAACGLTPFVNPFGMEMLNTWRRIVGSKVLPEVVNEHMPLDPSSPLGLTVIGFGVLYLALLAGTLPRMPRVSWLVPLAWLVLSFKGIRQGPLFAITAAVAVADLWPHTVWHRLLVKYGDGSLAHAPEGRPGWAWAAIPAAVVLLIATLQLTGVEAPVVGRGWARLDPDFIPVELADEMRAYAAAVPPGTPVFNDANLGGFLIYHTPTLKIFMDDRCELYGDDWIRTYADTLGLPPAELGPVFEGWAGRYGFRRAIVMTDPAGVDKPPIERYLMGSGGWREVARGKRAVVFDRVN
ncbi:MAG TPA: hypothetical protein VD866_10375, partial [Urbifossiella sp.]|nr:hypothetical protein [Urbifossiella sp.]